MNDPATSGIVANGSLDPIHLCVLSDQSQSAWYFQNATSGFDAFDPDGLVCWVRGLVDRDVVASSIVSQSYGISNRRHLQRYRRCGSSRQNAGTYL